MDENEVKEAVVILDTRKQKRISELHRFTLLTIGIYGSLCCSFGYAFNIISGAMLTQNNLSVMDIILISSVGPAVGYFMIPWGTLYDLFGPFPLSIPAVTILLIGQICLGLSFTGTIKGTRSRLTLFNVLVSIGITMYEMLNSITMVSHFPVDKGAVVGLLKTFTGLGTALFGTIQLGFFDKKHDHYIYFLAAFGAVTGIPIILFMRQAPYILTGYQVMKWPKERQEERANRKVQYMKQRPPAVVFLYGFILVIILIIYLPIQSAMLTYEKLGDSYKLGFAIATVVLLAMGLLIIPFTVIADRYKIVRRIHDEDDNASNQQLSSSQDPDDANQDEAALDTIEVEEPKVETELDYLAPQYQTSFLRNLLTLRLWALVWSVFVTIGPELSITYNAAYIYGAIAREPQTDEMRVLLSVLNGSGSAIGRLMMAYLEFWSQKKKAEDRIPITFTFFIPNATVILSLILFLTLPPAVLPLSFTINSFGNGFLNSTMILISRTLYAKDQAKHYHMCFVATTFGILIFNLALYGVYYDKESKKYNVAKGKACYHRSCVRVPHIVMLVFTCTGILSILYFHLKYTFFCRRVLAERARLVEEALQQVEGEEADQMEPIKASALGEVFVADELNDSLGDRREQRQQQP